MKITRIPTPLAVAVLLGLASLTGAYTNAQAETKAANATVTLEAELLDPAKQAAYRQEAEKLLACDPISDPQEKAAAFAKLAVMKWDRKQMGCGVRYGFELAQLQPENVELQLQVLGAHVEYFSVLDKSYSRLYSSSAVKDAELRLRWAETREHNETLLKGLAPLAGQVPEITALRGINTLLSLQHEAGEKEKLAAPGLALGDLEAAVKAKPDVLDGAALLTLGTLILGLPEFAGGDIDRAIKLLEQGNEIVPNNLQLKTALIDAELGERNKDKALAILQAAMKISEEGQNGQDYADSLRILVGQAVRLDQRDIAKQIDTRRDAFLAAHSYIDPRKTSAATGHGGVDPFTGQDPDKIQ
jgi:tetratricopeptide (TPR) repeat protein